MNQIIQNEDYLSRVDNIIVTLIDVKSIKQQAIRANLEPLGYTINNLSQSDYYKHYQNIDSQLVIVDVKSHGYNILNIRLKYVKSTEFHRDRIMPPVLAIVSETENNKEKVFLHGATDYISCPLIPDELISRVTQITHNYQSAAEVAGDYSLVKTGNEVRHENEITENSSAYLLAKKISQYLSSNLDHDIRMTELSRQMGVNRNKLAFVFKEYYGSSPFSWLREQRMKKARNLLLSSDKKIDVISQEVGYSDVSNFSTCFKRYFTYSPLNFRKRMRQTNK